VEIIGYGVDGHPLVHLGRVVLDDLQVRQLQNAGWRGTDVPDVLAPEARPSSAPG